MNKIIVLAGSWDEFNRYMIKIGENPKKLNGKYLYGRRREDILGIEVSDVEVVGTFWKNTSAREGLYEEAISRIR